MTGRLDVLSPRKKRNGETYWMKIGAAFQKDGGKFSVELDALPLPDETGRCSLLLSPPRQQGQGAARRHEDQRQNGRGGYGDDPYGQYP